MKEIDLGEPTSFLDHVCLACTQGKRETSEDIVDNYKICSNPGSVQEQKKKYVAQGNRTQTSLHGPVICKVMQRNVWSDIVNWRTEQPSNCTKSQLHALTTTNSRKKKWDLSENCQRFAQILFQKCLNLARAVTKWTKACDKRSARLISYIHHTCENRQCCCVGNTAQHCRLGMFQDSDFAGDLEDSKSTSGGVSCIFGSHTFVPGSWMLQETDSCFTQFHRR